MYYEDPSIFTIRIACIWVFEKCIITDYNSKKQLLPIPKGDLCFQNTTKKNLTVFF
jgi:hypothetical protein